MRFHKLCIDSNLDVVYYKIWRFSCKRGEKQEGKKFGAPVKLAHDLLQIMRHILVSSFALLGAHKS